MGRRALTLAALAVAVSLAAGCGSDEQSIAVVKKFYAAVNAEDIDRAMTYVSQDAVFVNPTGRYDGKAQIRKFLARGTSTDTRFEHSNFRVKAVGRVVYDFVVMDGGQQVAQGMDGLTRVAEGKIYFDGTEADEPR